jgi:hypothetical protein
MDDALARMMEAYAEDAVDHARQRFHLTLDYSDESVNLVEGLLDKLHREFPRGIKRLFKRPPSQEVIATIAKMYRGYVGEVVRRNHGGEWRVQSNVPGVDGPVIAFRVRGGTWFLPAKVYKRVLNGSEDATPIVQLRESVPPRTKVTVRGAWLIASNENRSGTAIRRWSPTCFRCLILRRAMMRRLLLAVAVLLMTAPAARGDIIRFEFTGMQYRADGESPVAGLFEYDTETPDANPDPRIGYYPQDGFSFTVWFDGQEYSTTHFALRVGAAMMSGHYAWRWDEVLTDNGFLLMVEAGSGIDQDGNPCRVEWSDKLATSACQPRYPGFETDPPQTPFGSFITTSASYSVSETHPVPEPGSVLLLGVGIASVVGCRRRWRR